MYSQLLIAALAASVSANVVVPGHLPMRRELQNLARQTDSAASPSGTAASDADCEMLLMSMAATIPTPAPALESYEETYSATDPCSYSVPKSLSGDYDDYTSSVYSWYSASSVAVYSILSECPQYADETAGIAVCSTATGLAAGGSGSSTSVSSAGSSATTTGSASGSSAATGSSGSSSSSSTGTASGSSASASASGSGATAREIGIVGAVLAGVLGVAVAL
ncbi:hypothetical protein VMCG_02148 [Cytospora schulzeri]|uniref:Infection structure specific protein n=1 Tax=Cytospora schulzeri TaxID=448051 RepID=A0A423X1K1_9PEZI|nr:hypothetical protein VMCG_02148 [Valsa malicola]